MSRRGLLGVALSIPVATAVGSAPAAASALADLTVFNVKDFGAVGTGHASTDDTLAIQAAIDAAHDASGIDLGGNRGPVRGGVVYFPPGAYRTTSPLRYRPYVCLQGAGSQASRVFNDVSDLFAWDASNGTVYEAHASDIWFSTGPTGGHVFSLSGGSGGGIAKTTFTRVKATTSNPAASIWRQRDRSQLIDVTYFACVFDTVGRTVPAFDVAVGGNDCNSVRWLSSWCHSHGATGAPFFRIECTGAWNYNLSFRDLVGEQNGGGFIHLYAVDGAIIENSPDWDFIGIYTDDLYKISPSPGSGNPSKNVRVENSYRIANKLADGSPGGFVPGKYDINAGSAANLNISIQGCTPPGLALRAAVSGDAHIDGRTSGFKTVTATYALTAEDPEEVLCNSATPITVTLPAPINMPFGRQFRIKNVGAGTVTIANTIDGTANRTLARWDKLAVRTDGENATLGRIWFSI